MRQLLITFSLLIFASSCLSQPKIAWFSTLQSDLSEKSGFWKRVHDMVAATAEDLELELNIYYAEENYIKLIEQVDTTLTNPDTRPDGIIFHNYKRTGEHILARAEQYGVKSMVFNAGFAYLETPDFAPRMKYKHWIGEILPDDRYAGAELFVQLNKAAKRLPQYKARRKSQVLAMEGNRASAAYLARKQGLTNELADSQDTEFTQYIPADWSRKVASEQFPVIIKRYPDIKIFWAANDNMALGLIDGAKGTTHIPGRDFVVGGIDWLPESFQAVKEGKMTVTIGGHFVEGMWALILLYDYLNGHDFADQYSLSLRTQMLAVNKEVLGTYGNITDKLQLENLRELDFRSFTKSHNKDLNQYQFDISQLLNHL